MGECKATDTRIQKEKKCYYMNKTLNMLMKNSDEIVERKKLLQIKRNKENIDGMYDILIDALITTASKRKAEDNKELYDIINRFCMICSVCGYFNGKCEASAKKRNKQGCALDYRIMKNLLIRRNIQDSQRD